MCKECAEPVSCKGRVSAGIRIHSDATRGTEGACRCAHVARGRVGASAWIPCPDRGVSLWTVGWYLVKPLYILVLLHCRGYCNLILYIYR